GHICAVMRQRWTRRTLSLLTALFVASFLLLCAGSLMLLRERMFADVARNEQRLLYSTNHQEILDACDALRAASKATTTQPVTINNGPRVSGRVPAALQKLDYEFITVFPDRVVITFGSGFYHWGFEATRAQAQMGQKALIPGLWYWNESNRIPPAPA